jgi:5-methylcytosine-specific restriction enzyme A
MARSARDREGNTRQALVFLLISDEPNHVEPGTADISGETDIDGLRGKALEAASTPKASSVADSKRTFYQRSQAVRRYVLGFFAGPLEKAYSRFGIRNLCRKANSNY